METIVDGWTTELCCGYVGHCLCLCSHWCLFFPPLFGHIQHVFYFEENVSSACKTWYGWLPGVLLWGCLLLMCCGWLPGVLLWGCLLLMFLGWMPEHCYSVANVLWVVARVLLCGCLSLMCCGWLPGCCYAGANMLWVVARVLLFGCFFNVLWVVARVLLCGW